MVTNNGQFTARYYGTQDAAERQIWQRITTISLSIPAHADDKTERVCTYADKTRGSQCTGGVAHGRLAVEAGRLSESIRSILQCQHGQRHRDNHTETRPHDLPTTRPPHRTTRRNQSKSQQALMTRAPPVDCCWQRRADCGVKVDRMDSRATTDGGTPNGVFHFKKNGLVSDAFSAGESAAPAAQANPRMSRSPSSVLIVSSFPSSTRRVSADRVPRGAGAPPKRSILSVLPAAGQRV